MRTVVQAGGSAALAVDVAAANGMAVATVHSSTAIQRCFIEASILNVGMERDADNDCTNVKPTRG
jgi:hypothetical protein